MKIAVYADQPSLITPARAIATQLKLPFTDTLQEWDYVLILTEHFLGLKKTQDRSLPLYVDFLSERMAYRVSHASLRKELLPRALGLKGNTHPVIVDATAGLGRDSFMIASLGFEVQSIERSPLIFTLLKDGLERAAKTQASVNRIHLINADAIEWLSTAAKPQIIYLDPMFPDRKKSALTKKDMRYFHEVIGDDVDAEMLLKTALASATKRVVVKRPRLAPHLANLKPNFSLSGSSSRFDVYLLVPT